MPACAALGCRNSTDKTSTLHNSPTDASFHGFPLHNVHLLKQWLHKLKRLDFKPSKASKLCSAHFMSDCFKEGSKPTTKERRKRRLRESAIPTVFAHSLTETPTVSSAERTRRQERRAQDKVENLSRTDDKNNLTPYPVSLYQIIRKCQESNGIPVLKRRTLSTPCETKPREIIANVPANIPAYGGFQLDSKDGIVKERRPSNISASGIKTEPLDPTDTDKNVQLIDKEASWVRRTSQTPSQVPFCSKASQKWMTSSQHLVRQRPHAETSVVSSATAHQFPPQCSVFVGTSEALRTGSPQVPTQEPVPTDISCMQSATSQPTTQELEVIERITSPHLSTQPDDAETPQNRTEYTPVSECNNERKTRSPYPVSLYQIIQPAQVTSQDETENLSSTGDDDNNSAPYPVALYQIIQKGRKSNEERQQPIVNPVIKKEPVDSSDTDKNMGKMQPLHTQASWVQRTASPQLPTQEPVWSDTSQKWRTFSSRQSEEQQPHAETSVVTRTTAHQFSQQCSVFVGTSEGLRTGSPQLPTQEPVFTGISCMQSAASQPPTQEIIERIASPHLSTQQPDASCMLRATSQQFLHSRQVNAGTTEALSATPQQSNQKLPITQEGYSQTSESLSATPQQCPNSQQVNAGTTEVLSATPQQSNQQLPIMQEGYSQTSESLSAIFQQSNQQLPIMQEGYSQTSESLSATLQQSNQQLPIMQEGYSQTSESLNATSQLSNQQLPTTQESDSQTSEVLRTTPPQLPQQPVLTDASCGPSATSQLPTLQEAQAADSPNTSVSEAEGIYNVPDKIYVGGENGEPPEEYVAAFIYLPDEEGSRDPEAPAPHQKKGLIFVPRETLSSLSDLNLVDNPEDSPEVESEPEPEPSEEEIFKHVCFSAKHDHSYSSKPVLSRGVQTMGETTEATEPVVPAKKTRKKKRRGRKRKLNKELELPIVEGKKCRSQDLPKTD